MRKKFNYIFLTGITVIRVLIGIALATGAAMGTELLLIRYVPEADEATRFLYVIAVYGIISVVVSMITVERYYKLQKKLGL